MSASANELPGCLLLMVVCVHLPVNYLDAFLNCYVPVSVSKIPLLDSFVWSKTESQHAGLAWLDVEYDMPDFLDCYMILC
jgi:hypothetical protein